MNTKLREKVFDLTLFLINNIGIIVILPNADKPHSLLKEFSCQKSKKIGIKVLIYIGESLISLMLFYNSLSCSIFSKKNLHCLDTHCFFTVDPDFSDSNYAIHVDFSPPYCNHPLFDHSILL